MSNRWATSIPTSSAPYLVALKEMASVRKVKIAKAGERIWIRGESGSNEEAFELDRKLRQITGAIRFELLEDGQLIRAGQAVPNTHLPDSQDITWKPLTEWIELELPLASLAGQSPNRIDLHIVRGRSRHANERQEPSVLICQIDVLSQWVGQTSAHRLKRLSFACNDSGSVIVRGTPLPPIRGTTLVEYKSIAIEVGYCWAPPVSIETLMRIIAVPKDHLLICRSADERDDAQPKQLIDLNEFVSATRSGIRATAIKLGASR